MYFESSTIDCVYTRFEKKYQTLKNDVISLRRLHRSCEPCKLSVKDNGVCDCTVIEPKNDNLEFHHHGYTRSMVFTVSKDLVSTGFMHIVIKLHKVEDGQSSKGDKTVR